MIHSIPDPPAWASNTPTPLSWKQELSYGNAAKAQHKKKKFKKAAQKKEREKPSYTAV